MPVAVSLPPSAPGQPALGAFLWLPADARSGPAIVMAHGCGGIGKGGKPSARFSDWALRFRDAGFRVLLVDSFGARGIQELCTVKFADRKLKQRQRVSDVLGAADWLRARGDVTGVVLAGWSHGGGTVLDTLQDKGATRFDAMLAFYPGCTRFAAKGGRFRAPVPLVIHIGEADDWTPAAPCVQLRDAAQARGLDVTVHTYAGAYHDFDSATGKLHHRAEVPNGVNPGQGVMVGPNPKARALARERVMNWLEAYRPGKPGAGGEPASPSAGQDGLPLPRSA
ncbi:dienelactone hydrolase family protein [Uliginosibacterium sp. H1]|uniref:dienelactone hydrolase family protein n=1 Tax=Uliginosibacterium sp. H1 TaxID=3114757 RepID=UPI002E16BAE7|nr:dienelactone hydrolase family protein [Uliginosibacterium sp. H1]